MFVTLNSLFIAQMFYCYHCRMIATETKNKKGRPKKESHTGFRNGSLFCYNCGTSYKILLPQPVTMAVSLMEQFTKDHAHCKPVWKEPEPDMTQSYKDRVTWWAKNGEHGVSSKTIWSFMVSGSGLYSGDFKYVLADLTEILIPPTQYCHPHDPDDFRRCYKLLKCVPEWKDARSMKMLRTISPVWNKLVENWDKLTELLEEGIKTDQANGMYELMKQCGC